MILGTLEEALLKYRVTTIPASNIENDPNANPVNWKGIWVNWKDSNPMKHIQSPDEVPSSSLAGSTIAIMAVILGLLIVGIFTLIGLKCARKSSPGSVSLPNDDNFQGIRGRSPAPEDHLNERRISQLSKDLPNFKGISSLKDVARSVD